MISNKYINVIITVITIIALAIATVFAVYPKSVSTNSQIATSKYMDNIFNKDKVLEINIDIEDDNWNKMIENAMNEEYVSANITVNDNTYYNVGIRPKGNSSLSSIAKDDTTDRFSFKINFDKYQDGQSLEGLTELALNNIMSDSTYMKEYLSYELFNKMGVKTPGFSYANIKINNKDWGLYLAVEIIDKEFTERNYGSLEGNLYKPEGMEIGGGEMQGQNGKAPENNGQMQMPPMGDMPQEGNGPQAGDMPPIGEKPEMEDMPKAENGQKEIKTNENQGEPPGEVPMNMNGNGGKIGGDSGGTNLVWKGEDISNYSNVIDSAVFKNTSDNDKAKVVEMIKNLSEGTNLETYLNVDEILRYFAVNTFLVNLDSYASNMKHNYYLYEENGRFEILPWDFNLSFGGFEINDSSKAINFPIDNPVTDSLENSPLIGKLLEVPEYKDLYHKYLKEIVDNYINNGEYTNSINKIDKLINNYVKNDATAFYTYEEYKNSIPNIISFGIDRAKSISAQLSGEQTSTEYGNIETTVDLKALGTMNMGGNKNIDDKNNLDNNKNINREAVAKAMEIIKSSPDGNLTEDQIKQLNELGISEDMISRFNNRPIDKGVNGKDKDGTLGNQNMKFSIILVLISAITMILSILVSIRFKRKRL